MVNNKNGNRGINKSITEQNNIKNASDIFKFGIIFGIIFFIGF